jgi:N-acetylglucosaminyldiphosphoundecaprenol N-acetyl-beta-D-mannosaminyltransferase
MASDTGRRTGALTAGTLAQDSVRILGCRVDRVDMAGAVERVASFIEAGRFAQIVTLGAEMANLAYRDERYRDVINAADLVVPDTIGIVLASRWLGRPVPALIPGIDLLDRLLAECSSRGWPVFLLGGAQGVADQAAGVLMQHRTGLQIAGTQHGYFEAGQGAEVALRIRTSGARLVAVGMGFPRQENWVAEHRAGLGTVACIGVGGAFDVISGRLPRAPLAIRRAGLEWLYRLVREPRRFARQLALPVFAARALRQAFFERGHGEQ